MRKFFENLEIEEYFLLLLSSILFLWLIFLNFRFSFDFNSLLKQSFLAVNLAISWWYQGFIFFLLLYLFLRSGFFLFKEIFSTKNQKIKKRVYFSKEDWRGLFSFFKSFFLITLSFSLATLLNGVLGQITKNRLVSEKILEWDIKIFGDSPVFWLNSLNNPYRSVLNIISFLAINSFFSLSFLMSSCLFFFYFEKNSYFFKGLVISSFLLLIFGFIFWYHFPAYSPLNAFIAEKKLERSGYEPFEKIKKFQEKMWQEQKKNPPVSTFPSMHWGWGIILVYFLFRKKNLTIFISLPWFLLMAFGSLFLGCHYLVDGIVAIFLAFFSVLIAEFLIIFERKKMKKGSQNEEIFKVKLKEFLLEPFRELFDLLKSSLIFK